MKGRLTPQDLDDMIVGVEYLRPQIGTLTICVLTLSNGCTLTGQSNVIDPDNYDRELGEKAAFNNAKGKIWEAEGYALKRDLERMPELAAKAAHEVNRIWCEHTGDTSQPTWGEAPEWQQESALMGVHAIMSNPAQTPDQSHESWLAHKLADGWKWGAVKNPETKEHPCMVPYAELPAEQRIKDAFFTTVVKTLTA